MKRGLSIRILKNESRTHSAMNVCGMVPVFSEKRQGTVRGPVLSDYMMDFMLAVCYAVYVAEDSAGTWGRHSPAIMAMPTGKRG